MHALAFLAVAPYVLVSVLDMFLHAGTWTPTGSMKIARGQHSMTVLPNGNAISAGGYDFVSELASTEVYTASTGQWSLVAPMRTGRVYFDLIALNDGKVLAAGGQNDSFFADTSSELFDPATSKWSPTGSLPVPQEYYSAVLLSDGTALVTGMSGFQPLPAISVGTTAPTKILGYSFLADKFCPPVAGGLNNTSVIGNSVIYNEAAGELPLSSHRYCM